MVRQKTDSGPSRSPPAFQALTPADQDTLRRAAFLASTMNRPVTDLLLEVSPMTAPLISQPSRPVHNNPTGGEEEDAPDSGRVFDSTHGVQGDEGFHGHEDATRIWNTHPHEFIDSRPSLEFDSLGDYAFIEDILALNPSVPHTGFGVMMKSGESRPGPGNIHNDQLLPLSSAGRLLVNPHAGRVLSLVSPDSQASVLSDTTLVHRDEPVNSFTDEANASDDSSASNAEGRAPDASHRTSLDSTVSDWSLVEMSQAGLRSPDATPGSNDSGRGFTQLIFVDPSEPRPPPRPRGRFQTQKLREETGITRRLKACVRCRMQKLRCKYDADDPAGICQTCKEVSYQKIYTLPCVRHRITECILFRRGKGPGLEFTVRWPTMCLKDIQEWVSDEVRTIQVESDVCPVPLQLSVRKFVLKPGDSEHRGWMDGRIKKFTRTTPWAIANMSTAVDDMRAYVTANVFNSVDHFLKNSDELVRKTYEFARKHMYRVPSEDERKLLGNFFRLWFAVRRTATIEHIVSKEVLDMTLEPDRSFPLYGKIPLPPVMIQQLDMILTLGILDPLHRQVLEDFQKIVLDHKPRSWMTIYLITFMSLHSCASITAENYRNARKHGLRRRYSIPNFIADRHHAANVFLSHYHYCTQHCNPFKLDWKKRHTTPFADISTDEIHFIKRTNELVEENGKRMRDDLEENLYEDELYFIAQMFEDNWSPRDTVIDYDDGTVGNVLLNKFYEG